MRGMGRNGLAPKRGCAFFCDYITFTARAQENCANFCNFYYVNAENAKNIPKILSIRLLF